MKAIQFEKAGLPNEVLKVIEKAKPEPKEGQVRIKVSMANIIPADLMFIQDMYGIRPQFPQTAGFEATGTIDAIGEGVQMSIGTSVIFTSSGVWSEFVCVPVNTVIQKPATLSEEVACQAFVNPLTAYGLLMEAGLKSGDWLLLTAANSAFSKFVIQLAVQKGINIIGTVRKDDQKQPLLNLGAKAVINDNTEHFYHEVKLATEGEMVTAAFDAVGGNLGDKVLNTLKVNGKLFVYGLLSLKPIPLNSGLLIFKNITVSGFWLSIWISQLSKEQRQEIIPKVLGMLVSKEMKANVEAIYSIDEIHKAIQHMESPGRNGKILLRIAKN